MNYRKNAELLEGFEFKEDIKKMKRVHNNTLEIILNDNTKIYRFHNTNIITINKIVTYNSGGYRTVTTKERINKFNPLNNTIYQENYIWYIDNIEFYDGIRFDLNGNLISESKTIDKKIWNKCKREINKFVSLIDDLETIPQPSSEDCWDCVMVNKEGKPLGEITNDYNHLVSHIRQGYLHGSLILNALRERGYTDMFIYMVFSYYGIRWKHTIKIALRQYLIKRILNEKYYKL